MTAQPTISKAGQPLYWVKDNQFGHHLVVHADAVAANPNAYTILPGSPLDEAGNPRTPALKTSSPSEPKTEEKK